MARDIFKIDIELGVNGPEYEIDSISEWEEHFDGNKELKEDLTAAIIEQVQAVLPMVTVNGEKFEVHIVDHGAIRTDDIDLTANEIMILDAQQAKREK